MVFFEELVRQL